MKAKALVGTMLILSLVTLAFHAVPTVAFTLPPIKVGILGPMHWIQGQGMLEGAQLAAARINALGGIAGHEVVLTGESTHPDAATDPTGPFGAAAMTALMAQDVDFVIGGFRSEAVFGAREVAMDNQIIYFITGAATDELIDDSTMTSLNTVRGNYERYKYLFRTTPPNSTTLGRTLSAFLKYAMITKLMPIYTGYAEPLRIAVVSENLPWADGIYADVTNEAFWNTVMGLRAYGGVEVVYQTQVDPVNPAWVPGVVSDLDLGIDGIPNSGDEPRLIIHVLSGPVGRAFVFQWAIVQVKAAFVGIDVPGMEIPLHWDVTGGACETETFLATAGGADDRDAGTPMNTEGPTRTKDFYRDYYDTYGHAPIYTSYGAYDTLIGLWENIETWVALVGHDWPPANQAEYDKLIPVIESTNRTGVVGQFKYTTPNPGHNGDYSDYDPNTAGNQPYPFAAEKTALGVPTYMGTLHDVFVNEIGPTWTQGYVRPLVVQWQAGRLEVVWPMDQPYSKIWAIPKRMIPAQYHTDVNQDGIRNIHDVAIVEYAFFSAPGDPQWQFVADLDGNGFIGPLDWFNVTLDYGYPIPLPYP